MADHGLTASPVETAQRVLDQYDEQTGPRSIRDQQMREYRLASVLRALLATTREDNAPETIAHEVIARRYGSVETLDMALQVDLGGLTSRGILNMLKDAAAAGLDSREEF